MCISLHADSLTQSSQLAIQLAVRVCVRLSGLAITNIEIFQNTLPLLFSLISRRAACKTRVPCSKAVSRRHPSCKNDYKIPFCCHTLFWNFLTKIYVFLLKGQGFCGRFTMYMLSFPGSLSIEATYLPFVLNWLLNALYCTRAITLPYLFFIIISL